MGGHLSHYVFCVEGCLRLQKNIGLRPMNRRNTTSKRFWWKWPYICVLCIGNTGKCHFLAHICYFEHFKMVFMNYYHGWSCLARLDRHFEKKNVPYHVPFSTYDVICWRYFAIFHQFDHLIAFLSNLTWLLRKIYQG